MLIQPLKHLKVVTIDPKGGDAARYDEIKAGDAKERAGNFKQTQVVEQASSQEQNVNQNNDINSKVTGDNNYVGNTQDNSVRYFGGNTTNFNYQSVVKVLIPLPR